MSFKLLVRWIRIGLLLNCSLCVAQTPPNLQQELAEHSRKLQQYLQEKKPDLAIPELQALIALDPTNVDARGNLGVLLFFKGDCAHATPELRAATARRPRLWHVQVLLATCERQAGDLPAARNDFETAFPHLEDKKVILQAGMELIDLYTATGDLDKAAVVVERLRGQDPANVRVLYTAYRIYTQLAGQAMLGLSMADPDSAEMHQMVAHETLRYGDPDGAIAHYRAAIKINPKLPGIHFELAEVLNDSLKPAYKEEAVREYRLALELNPADEKAECRLGEIDAESGNISQAYKDYAKAVQLAPGDVDAKLGLAKTMILMKQQDQALPLLEQVVQLEPANDAAHFLLSKAYWQSGRKEDAKREVDLYKRYKAMQDKLQAVYKEMRINPTRFDTGDLDKDHDVNSK